MADLCISSTFIHNLLLLCVFVILPSSDFSKRAIACERFIFETRSMTRHISVFMTLRSFSARAISRLPINL